MDLKLGIYPVLHTSLVTLRGLKLLVLVRGIGSASTLLQLDVEDSFK
jgi:hypothetical protein